MTRPPRSPRRNAAILGYLLVVATIGLGFLALQPGLPGLVRLAVGLMWLAVALPCLYLMRWLLRSGRG
ncbi:hypothetical protein KBX37_26740 [Micromonospora sp. U56]|uniref:hypothetical protein n=1 Tax=Micromonospora sp. U56 TaxID=2824900 RepID=UPI001B3825DC|nr:hypothetical protein [Micromonospora sp. U56]MBQ0896646.1 hypothetical protein [Micromonospora sp. U56]